MPGAPYASSLSVTSVSFECIIGIISSQMKTLKLREVKRFFQGHTANRWQSQDLNCGLLSPEQRQTLSWVLPPSWLLSPVASCKLNSALTLGSFSHLLISLLDRVMIIIVPRARCCPRRHMCPSTLNVPNCLIGWVQRQPHFTDERSRHRIGVTKARIPMHRVWL